MRKRTARDRDDHADLEKKRGGHRSVLQIALDVVAQDGTEFAAQTVDISRTGALLWVSDERFVPPDKVSDLEYHLDRVEELFPDGIDLRFLGGQVCRPAEVVRVTRKGRSPYDPILVACRFEEALAVDEVRALGQEPEAVGTAPRQAARAPEIRVVRRDSAPDATHSPERRTAPRADHLLHVEVAGDYGAYDAQAVNVSYSGVLLTIRDDAFAAPSQPDQLAVLTKRMGFQFGNGLTVRFLGAGFEVSAQVARITEIVEDGTRNMVIGCRFDRPLTHAECAKLDVEPPPAPEPRADFESVLQEAQDAGARDARGLLARAVEHKASDLHLKADSPPRARVDGTLVDLGQHPLGKEAVESLAVELLPPDVHERFAAGRDVEAMFEHADARFRVNVFRESGRTALAVRCLPAAPPELAKIGLSEAAQALADAPKGLVLVGGGLGSGRTTTLAAMADYANRSRACHVVVVTDLAEYRLADAAGHVTHREIGRDAPTAAATLARALRQDPDVLVVGEIGDAATAGLVLRAAESGCLVLASVPTATAGAAVARVIGFFPEAQREQAREQLAHALLGVVVQALVPAIAGGRVPAEEHIIAGDAVRGLLREGREGGLQELMQERSGQGLRTLESSLNALVEKGVVTHGAAVARANRAKEIRPAPDASKG